MRNIILSAARATLRVRRKNKQQSWISHGTRAFIEEKCKCKKDTVVFRELKWRVKTALSKDKQAQLDRMCEQIEDMENRGSTKDIFGRVNKLTKQACPTLKLIQDETGSYG